MGALRTTIFLSSAVALVNTGFAMVFPIFPKLLEQFAGGAWELGVLAAGYGIAYAGLSPMFGLYSDRIGKKKVILTGLFGFTISNLLLIIASDIPQLFLARLLEGAFSAAVFPAAVSFISDLASDEDQARYIGYLTAGNTIGLIIGPVVGGFLFDVSLYTPFYVSALLSSLAFLWAFLQLRETVEERHTRQTSEHISLRTVLQNLPQPGIIFGVFILVDFLLVIQWLLVEPGISFYIFDVLLLQPRDFGFFVASFGIFTTLAQVFFGNLSDNYGRRPVIMVAGVFNTIFLVMLLFSSTTLMLVAAAAVAGLGSGLGTPAMKALLAESCREQYKTTIIGIENGFVATAIIMGPLVGGWLYDTYGIFVTLYAAISLAFLATVIAVLLIFNSSRQDVVNVYNIVTAN